MKKYIAIGYQYQKLVAVIAVLVILCTIAFGMLVPIMQADAETKYSDVLDDLNADPSFDVAQWPHKNGEHTLQVITVAEGADKELFVYVYQPAKESKEYCATYIRLSDTIDDEIAPKDYKLKLLSKNNTLYKYMVEGYTVKSDAVRYYIVVQLMRPFINGYDTYANYDNTISAVAFAVNRQFKFSTINGKTSISALDVETILITDKLVGHVVHEKDQFIQIKYTYMHFVAFKSDHDIDDLLEADVAWVTQAYHKNTLTGYSYSTPKDNFVTLYAKNQHEIKYGFGNKQKAVWNEIQSVSDFISSNNINSIYATALVNVHQAEKLTEEAKNNLRNMDWVLQFYQVDETTMRQIFGPAAGLQTDHDGVNVTDVTILRLKFVTNGITYNLGVVDNKQTGSDKSSNESKIVITPAEGSDWMWTLIAIALLVVLVVLLWPAMPYIIRFLAWFISLPFKSAKRMADAYNSPEAKARRAERKRQRKVGKEQQRAEKVKEQLKSGKKEWADLTETEEQALLKDDEYINSMFDDDSWNGED